MEYFADKMTGCGIILADRVVFTELIQTAEYILIYKKRIHEADISIV